MRLVNQLIKPIVPAWLVRHSPVTLRIYLISPTPSTHFAFKDEPSQQDTQCHQLINKRRCLSFRSFYRRHSLKVKQPWMPSHAYASEPRPSLLKAALI